jgi:ribosomal protein S18 acetylase RimI-like enzyme
MTPLTLRDLEGDDDLDGSIRPSLPWILAAGGPYLDWFFAETPIVERVESWMRRPTSELAIGRATVLDRGGEVVGGFIAMDGETLRRCRLADALASISGADPMRSTAARDRIGAAGGLFPTVGPEDLYLSKLGVVRAHRGTGLGRSLMEGFLARGRDQGYERFRLEVSATNATAIHLYRSFGFDVVGEGVVPGTDLNYLWMARW